MNILISGSSGLIGSALKTSLSASGHKVYGLLRNAKGDQAFYWNPDKNTIHLDESISLDVVIHLAGENIADGRWSQARKNKILHSRENGTLILSQAIAGLAHKPSLFISGSAIGFYGDTGTSAADESSPSGSGFLADVSRRWEQASDAAKQAGIRTVNIRTGVVLSPEGGVLKKMLLPFKLGLGGVIGNGEQWMSWVSIHDITRMIEFIINNPVANGPINLVSNQPVSNKTFTKTLGEVLRRPTFFPMPAFIAKLAFGEMADALLLSNSKVLPAKLNQLGYDTVDDELGLALTRLLSD